MDFVKEIEAGLRRSRFLNLEEAVVYIAQRHWDGWRVSAPEVTGVIKFANKDREITQAIFRKAINFMVKEKIFESRKQALDGVGRPRVVYEATEKGEDIIRQLVILV